MLWIAVAVAAMLVAWAFASPAEADGQLEIWLEPGWNLVGWLQQSGEVAALYDQLPGLEAILSPTRQAHPWIGDQWQVVSPGSTARVGPGDPLWLRMAEGQTGTWRQQPLALVPSRALQTGWQTVVWSWDADTWRGVERVRAISDRWGESFSFGPWEAAASVVGAGLQEVRRWDAESQRFEALGRRGEGSDELYMGPPIRHGDALLVRLAAPAQWRNPVGVEPVLGTRWMDVGAEQRLREALADARSSFRDVVGLAPPELVVVVERFPFPCLSGGGTRMVRLYLPCGSIEKLVDNAIIGNYADTLVRELESGPSRSEPIWLTGGLAHYSALRSRSGLGEPAYREAKDVMVGLARSTPLALTSEQFARDAWSPGPLWYSNREQLRTALWTLAVDWLARGYGEAALSRYVEQRRTVPWREAFRSAFGQPVEQFLARFGRYRDSLSADGRHWASRPYHQIMFPGAMTEERWELFETVEGIVDFFARRYGLTASTVTFMLDLPDTTYSREENAITPQSCGRVNGAVVIVSSICNFVFIFAHEYVHVLQEEQRWGGRHSPQPRWSFEGAADYFALIHYHHFQSDEAGTGFSDRETEAARLVRRYGDALSDLDLAERALDDRPYLVGALASRHLVAWRGSDALWATFGRSSTSDFADHFAAATGIGLGRFLEDFGFWLRELAESESTSK
ncbi:MAG: hypothetical protein OXH19_14150 [Chloroflexi bacterium]|nr:hypothetical protein [Chloroflexota bacterium]MCY3589962.1 hypothetical protein [Chloroflexota bacterium]MCY3684597.1 hypothetical protein [Chloroflexota bacterium]MDE2710007.1 hypothetical protein [Chloroflexota bacterium]